MTRFIWIFEYELVFLALPVDSANPILYSTFIANSSIRITHSPLTQNAKHKRRLSFFFHISVRSKGGARETRVWFLEVCKSCCCSRSQSWEVCWFEGDKCMGFLLLEGFGIVVFDVYSASIRSWFMSLFVSITRRGYRIILSLSILRFDLMYID